MNTIKTIAVATAFHGVLAGGVAEAKSHPSSGDKDAQIELLTRRLEQLEKRLEQSEARAAAAPAPKAPAVAEADKQTLKQVDQKVKLLERKLEVDKEESKAKWASFPKNVELGTQGLKVVSQDENFIMYMRALIQADGRFFVDDSKGGDAGNTNGDSLPDQFTLRRVRPILEGTVWKWFDYRIMPDFAGGTTRLFDAYADLRYFREASLTAGKFKAPVSLERLQSASALTFVERAFPTQLAPNRDVGFMLHGEFDKPGYATDFSKLERNQTPAGSFPLYMYPEFFSYQVGVFNGSRNNGNIDSDTNDSKEFQGRIFAHPFLHSGIEPLEGLGLGVAGTWGEPNDDKLSNYQSPGLNGIFSYANAARADGVHYRVYPQGYWIWGPFQLLGEYALSSQDLASQSTVNGRSVNVAETNTTDQAWNVTVSYMLTGEENVFLRQGIKPRHPFDPMYGIRPNQPFNPA
ncbi:porin, partial [Methyloterricola oryzae]|uniref:porin n=1 Tax=Methyloterricola oryzae TaxID=1495050 RepID=UPI0006994FD7